MLPSVFIAPPPSSAPSVSSRPSLHLNSCLFITLPGSLTGEVQLPGWSCLSTEEMIHWGPGAHQSLPIRGEVFQLQPPLQPVVLMPPERRQLLMLLVKESHPGSFHCPSNLLLGNLGAKKEGRVKRMGRKRVQEESEGSIPLKSSVSGLPSDPSFLWDYSQGS